MTLIKLWLTIDCRQTADNVLDFSCSHALCQMAAEIGQANTGATPKMSVIPCLKLGLCNKHRFCRCYVLILMILHIFIRCICIFLAVLVCVCVCAEKEPNSVIPLPENVVRQCRANTDPPHDVISVFTLLTCCA